MSPPPTWISSLVSVGSRLRRLLGASGVSLRDQAEAIRSSGLFDATWYGKRYGLDPAGALDHYMKMGAAEGFDPGPRFSTAFYLAQNDHIRRSGVNYLYHYIALGKDDGCSPTYPDKTNKLVEQEISVSLPISKYPKEHDLRVGVVIHAYYEELIPDLLKICDSVPKPYRIYIATKDGKDIPGATVKKLTNRGRNITTLTTLFGPELLDQEDLICHIHAKQSLHLGAKQSNWLAHLVDKTVGTPEYCKSIVGLFEENPHLGVAFARPYQGHSYEVYRRASNQASLQDLGNRLQIAPPQSEFLNFPAGCFFWARTQAIKQLLDGRFTYEDFPPEPFPPDGTLAHAIERIPAYLAKHNGFDFAELDGPKANTFRLNRSFKNLVTYDLTATPTRLKRLIDRHDTISFALFGTLFGETEKPREAVTEALQYARSKNKRIIYVEDSNLTEAQIKQVLQRQGFPAPDALYQSTAVGHNKRDGSMWRHIRKRELTDSRPLLHIGHDAIADVRQPLAARMEVFPVLSQRALAELKEEGISLWPNDI